MVKIFGSYETDLASQPSENDNISNDPNEFSHKKFQKRVNISNIS